SSRSCAPRAARSASNRRSRAKRSSWWSYPPRSCRLRSPQTPPRYASQTLFYFAEFARTLAGENPHEDSRRRQPNFLQLSARRPRVLSSPLVKRLTADRRARWFPLDMTHVLVVDDERGVQESLRLMLKDEFDVTAVGGVDDGLRVIDAKPT